jgi:hypothetical protein
VLDGEYGLLWAALLAYCWKFCSGVRCINVSQDHVVVVVFFMKILVLELECVCDYFLQQELCIIMIQETKSEIGRVEILH